MLEGKIARRPQASRPLRYQAPLNPADCRPRNPRAFNSLVSSLQSVSQAVKSVFVAPAHTNQAVGKANHYPVIWDSGASISVSPARCDFVGPLHPAPLGLRLQGIARGLKVEAVGTVAWSFIDTTGTLRTIKVEALLVPKARVRLLSTGGVMNAYPDETLTIQKDRLYLSGAPATTRLPLRRPIEIHLSDSTKLPTSTGYSLIAPEKAFQALRAALTTVSRTNENLSAAEKELLRWHYRLGHLGAKRIQFLMRSGVLAHSEGARRLHTSACRISRPPMCTACQYGKQTRRAAPGTTTHHVRDHADALRKDDLHPGQRVSVDHFVCSTRGRLEHTFGKEATDQQYVGGAIFVDHATGFVIVVCQVHLNTHETLKSLQHATEVFRDCGIVPQSFLSDNGSSFTSRDFQAHLKQFRQVSSFAGVGAHHHNGIAELSIRTIMTIARTCMLHAAIHWPETADAQLWTFAVAYAVHLSNHMPSLSSGLSPHDLFTRTRWPHAKFHGCHVWGCPVYVLDKKIQDGNKLPRWQPRCSRHMFVGLSPKHASTVPLVLNLDTGAISPQFHVVFDDWFATVASSSDSLPPIDSPEWQQLFGDSTYQYFFDDDDPADSPSAASDSPPLDSAVRSAHDRLAPPTPLPVPPPVACPPPTAPTPTQPPLQREPPPPSHPVTAPEEQSTPPPPRPSSPAASPLQRETATQPRQDPTPATSPTPTSSHHAPPTPAVAPRRSTRTHAAPVRYGYDGTHHVDLAEAYHFAQIADTRRFFVPLEPFALASKTKNNDPDIFTYDEAMKSPQRDKWMQAARNEIDELIKQGTWEEVPISEATTRILPGTWTFKIKRTPDGEIKKYKARWCLRGDLQEKEGDYYSPVVSWSTVRLFLVLSLVLKWKTISIDFNNAFLHATLPYSIWAHLPRGFQSSKGPGHCLRLVKSLYGISEAPRLFFDHCRSAFLDLGFKQSAYDACLFYKPNMLAVLFVDDLGLAAKDPDDLDRLIDALRAKGFSLTEEGNFAEFLGIKFEELSPGELKLTQRGLTDKIIRVTGLQECKPNVVPATQLALGSDPDGPPMSESWNYLSVVGMLLYLACNSRPDIAFAVSQVARFSSNPKASHAKAIKTIVRYLAGTRHEGTIMRPAGGLSLDLYVDADFCSLHGVEDSRDPISAKSRTGYMIFLAGCPLLWKSQLQTHVSLSTLEAEYSALSYALKSLLPLKRMLLELVAALDVDLTAEASVRARVFEDNQGALLLAQNHRITNRTQYFLVKWHWFWQHQSEFVFIKVESAHQRADYMTKGLNREAFEHNRLLSQGW